jgi:MFS family permease
MMRSLARYLALEGNIRVMAVQSVLSGLGYGMFLVVWQPYILSTGVSVVGLGVIQSVLNLSTAAGLIAWGVLSDRFGRKPVILASQACRLLSIVALIVSGNFAFLIAFAFLIGFSALFMVGNPARSALISESVDSRSLATAFSTLMAIGQITNTVMASAGGYIAVTSGYSPILYACVIGDLLGLLIFALYIKETREPPVEPLPAGSLVDGLRDLFMPEPGIRRLYLLFLVAGFSYGTGYSLLFGTLVDSYGFTALQLGLLSTAFNLSWGLLSIPVGKISDRFSRKTMLMASWTAALITVVGFLVFRSFEAFLILEMISALDPVLWIPAWMALLAEKLPSERLSTAMGKLDAYAKLTGIPSPWLGGLLYSAYGFKAPLTVHLGGMLIFGLLIYTYRE